jgi:outer membrane protein insertion porin family
VRRINVTGNTKTRDEVVRREMRQMEGAWYAADKVTRSRERVNRLGYFSDVNVETPAVTGTTDQVDMNVSVTEKPTGSIMAGAGFSSSEGFILSGSISQANVFGSGNYLSTQFNSGKINTVYSLSYTNPYYTDDGISRGFDIYQRKVNSSSLSVSRYDSDSIGGGVRFGVPLNEMDTVNFGLSVERTKLTTYDTTPVRYLDYVRDFGSSNTTLRGDAGWARDTRDSIIYPTKGSLQRAFGEMGLPGGTIKYYKLSYQHQWLRPLVQDYTLMLNGEAGYANGYGGKPLPFFKGFFAGGNTSVRGFRSSSLGPKDIDGNALGGNRRLVGNAEVLFPFPGMKKDKSLRVSLFLDGGSVFGDGDTAGQYSKISFADMRYSTGLAVSWQSPMGPMKFSIAAPLNSKETDKLERFQFILGSTF